MFFVGIDVSSAKHDCCVLDCSRKMIRSFMIVNSREGFSALSATLTELAAPENIKIGLEATGIYGDNLANFLRRKGFNVCTINPLLCKKHQNATTLRKTKNDRSDAKNIALIVASEDLQPDQPLSYHIVELKSLSRARFLTVKDRSSLKNKVKRIWRVKPLAQEKRFADYCKRNNIKTIKRFWHGSRNENWASIVQNGLLLNPNAVITGKMFGQGIYFAPSPNKSVGYTSYNGTYWARGNASRGFMGIYATAYGKPYMATTWGSDSERKMKADNANCVHATPANTGLRNDEVVFYSEEAVVMNYLVEFGD